MHLSRFPPSNPFSKRANHPRLGHQLTNRLAFSMPRFLLHAILTNRLTSPAHLTRRKKTQPAPPPCDERRSSQSRHNHIQFLSSFFPFSFFFSVYYYTGTNPPPPLTREPGLSPRQKTTKQGSSLCPSLFTSLSSNFPVQNVHHNPPKKGEKKKKIYHKRRSQNGSTEEIPHHPTGPSTHHKSYQESFQDFQAEKTSRSTTQQNTCTSHRPFFCFSPETGTSFLLHVLPTQPSLLAATRRNAKNAARENPPAAPAQHRPRFRVVSSVLVPPKARAA
ncbi:hypothetical protein HDV62DRAFT_364889 [Trichoderma sp. SZMC 28011]